MAEVPALPSVAIPQEQADVLMRLQHAVTVAQGQLNVAFGVVLAGHGVREFSAAGLDGYPDAPTITYRP